MTSSILMSLTVLKKTSVCSSEGPRGDEGKVGAASPLLRTPENFSTAQEVSSSRGSIERKGKDEHQK